MIIFSHGDAGLPTKEHTSRVTSLNLRKFQTCVSSSAQVLLLPNLPGRFWVFFPGPLAYLPCWREAQLLSTFQFGTVYILSCTALIAVQLRMYRVPNQMLISPES